MSNDPFRTRSDLETEAGVLGLAIDGTATDSEIDECCRRLIERVDSHKNGKQPKVVVVDCRAIETRSERFLASLRFSAEALTAAPWDLLVVAPESTSDMTDPFHVISDPLLLENAVRAFAGSPGKRQPLSPEEAERIRNWARANHDERVYVSALDEFKRTGDCGIQDIIDQLARDS
jgi:hypothetical protein